MTPLQPVLDHPLRVETRHANRLAKFRNAHPGSSWGVPPSLTAGRHEFKHLIRAEQIEPIAEFLSGRLELDKYSAGRSRDSYTVRSIYYDSPGFACYHAKENGEENRLKFRIRTYNDDQLSPLYLECKRRTDSVYTKRKMRLDEPMLDALRSRSGFDPDLAEPSSVVGQLLVNMDRHGFVPSSLVVYDRIAYVYPGQSDSIRVTLDRNLRARLFPRVDEIRGEADLVPLLYGWTILEVKFTDIVPSFLGQLVARHHLQRQACSKYALSIARLLDENPTKREGWIHAHIL